MWPGMRLTIWLRLGDSAMSIRSWCMFGSSRERWTLSRLRSYRRRWRPSRRRWRTSSSTWGRGGWRKGNSKSRMGYSNLSLMGLLGARRTTCLSVLWTRARSTVRKGEWQGPSEEWEARSEVRGRAVKRRGNRGKPLSFLGHLETRTRWEYHKITQTPPFIVATRPEGLMMNSSSLFDN